MFLVVLGLGLCVGFRVLFGVWFLCGCGCVIVGYGLACPGVGFAELNLHMSLT